VGRQGSCAQKIAQRYRNKHSSGKLGGNKQIKVQRIRPGPSKGSFVEGAWWDRALVEIKTGILV
jgi:hypothetical protein